MLRYSILFVLSVSVQSRNINSGKICGVEATSNLIHHNPWLVYLEYYRDDERVDIRCAATLIDSRHLLTAAHCVVTPRFTRLVARLGEYDITKTKDCVNGVCADEVLRIDIEDAIVNLAYDGVENDIAILKLVQDAPYTDFIRPACLPTSDFDPNTLFIASGWGKIPFKHHYSPTKKNLPLPFWDRKSCVAAYKNLHVPDNVICAGGIRGFDTCEGDSGGPLVIVKDVIEIRGVTSAGSNSCGTEDFPGMYTDVSFYLNWIKTVINGNTKIVRDFT